MHYSKCLPRMTYYKRKYNLNINHFKNSDIYGRTNISLPIYPKLKIKDVNKICKTIINLL